MSVDRVEGVAAAAGTAAATSAAASGAAAAGVSSGAAPTATGDAAAAGVDAVVVEGLVREHLALVGHVVAQVAGRLPGHVARDELSSAGLLALVLAARSFDAGRGVPFGAFAVVRVRGAVLDELRGMDWASRAVRSRARELERMRGQLSAALGRAPSRAELAAACGVSVAVVDAVAADVERAAVGSLQALAGEQERALPEAGDTPEGLVLRREQLGLLRDGVAELPARLRTVVERYYFAQHKMADIAADLGVTESRVSQLRAEALGYLRAALHAADPDGIPAPTRTSRHHTSYAATVTTRSTLAERLNHTTPLAEPRPLAVHTA
jgi:RNA polymerase sigma factor for flagellar operon FliA